RPHPLEGLCGSGIGRAGVVHSKPRLAAFLPGVSVARARPKCKPLHLGRTTPWTHASCWTSVLLNNRGDAMPSLAYTAPSSVEDAVRALAGASGTAKVLSGGTDLLVQLRSGRVKPDLIVDTKKIPGISGISERDGGFVIGAATPGAVLGESEA